MGYIATYSKLLQGRQPFQITTSEVIKQRNEKVLAQEGRMRIKLLEKKGGLNNPELTIERFIQQICKMN